MYDAHKEIYMAQVLIMKTSIVIMILICASSLSLATPVKLECPLLKHIDGLFINGERIRNMSRLRLNISFLTIGKKTRTGSLEPLYSLLFLHNFNDTLYIACSDSQKCEIFEFDHKRHQYTLCDSCDLKNEFPSCLNEQRYQIVLFDQETGTLVNGPIIEHDAGEGLITYIKNDSPKHSLHSLAKIENIHEKTTIPSTEQLSSSAIHQAMRNMLSFMKRDFEKKVIDFIKDAETFKAAMLTLIQESCQKRNRPHSLLLGWADSERGREMEHFHKTIVSFNDFYWFTNDLINFLSDMIHSCPKGMAQFKELMSIDGTRVSDHNE
jgi:hypothetical protein